MERRDVHVRGVAQIHLLCLTVIGLVAAGCVTAPAKSKPAISAAPAAPQSAAAPFSDPDEKHQTSLAAVEEFLERTQQYQSAPGSAAAQHSRSQTKESAAPAPEEARARPSLDQTFANAQVTLPDSGAARPALAIPAVQSISIRTTEAAAPKGTAAEPPKANATNAPLDTSADDGLMLSEKLIARLRTEAETSNDWPSQWRLRMTLLAFDHDAEAARVSTALSEPVRSLAVALIEAGVAIRNAGADPLVPAEEALQRTEQLYQAVRERADPQVLALALCRKVVTFGVYEEMAGEEFVAGRSIQTIVYSEIANLHAKATDDGFHETRLATRLEVLSAGGESHWQREEPEIIDRCRARRKDFFLAQRITLPPTLPAGEYVLKVFVEDKLANRGDEVSRPFTIVSPVSVARGKP